MPWTRRAPSPCAVLVLAAGTLAYAAPADERSHPARGGEGSPQTWLLKITPVYGPALRRVDFRFGHHESPWLLEHRPGQETIVRPSIRILGTTGQAWFGLDADLAWEGRCSLPGAWLAVNMDRTGAGLAGADLFYDLNARRLVIRTEGQFVRIDLTTGEISGPPSLIGAKRNLREHFLARHNEAFELRVQNGDTAGRSVFVLPDLASIAIGGARGDTRGSAEAVPASPALSPPSGLSSEEARALRRALAGLQTNGKAEADPAAELNQRRWTFGVEEPVAYPSGPAAAELPPALSSWPGKSLPRDGALLVRSSHEIAAERAIALLTNCWQARRRWLQRTTAERTVRDSDADGTDGRIEQQTRSLADRCGLSKDVDPAEAPSGRSLRRETLRLGEGLRALDEAITNLLAGASRAAEFARSAPRPRMTLAEAERACRGVGVGCGLRDEAACLAVDLAASGSPPPEDVGGLAELLAERLIARGWNELLAERWDRDGILSASSVMPAGRDLSSLAAALRRGTARDRRRMQDIGDRVARALTEACYTEAGQAEHVRQHLARRAANLLAAEPSRIAELVRDLDEGNVARPDGLEELLRVCGARPPEADEVSRELEEALLIAQGLTEMALERVDELALRWAGLSQASRQAEAAFRRAYAKQQEDVARLMEWVCRTYAAQLFGRRGLDDPQRKRLILATAAWWARQWGLDLCWVWSDLAIDITRRDGATAWQVRDLRVVLLDRPDPQAEAEERMARVEPPQPLPVGPVRLADGRTVAPRTVADLEVPTPEAEARARSDRQAGAGAPRVDGNRSTVTTGRLIVPHPPAAELADAEVTDVEPPAEARSGRVDERSGSAGAGPAAVEGTKVTDGTSPAARMADVDANVAARATASWQPGDVGSGTSRADRATPGVVRAPEPEPLYAPPVRGEERVVPVMLRPGKPSKARRVAVKARQTVRLVGMVSFVTAPRGPVRVVVDLGGGSPVAAELRVRSSPPMTEHGRATLIERDGQPWWRRTIRWGRLDAAAESFDVVFEAPRPEVPGQTLTLAFGVETGEEDARGHRPEQTVELLLMADR